MTNEMIKRIAMEQSAIDSNCKAEDFMLDVNVITISKDNTNARRYLKLPHVCDLTSYGNNIVATVNEKYRNVVSDYINKYAVEHCFETPNMHILNDAFQKDGYRVCFMAEYFLPDVEVLKALSCKYELKILTANDFKDLYKKEWSNALCETRKELDVLGVGAYVEDRLVGLAGCSADCETMWQIGVDVLPAYRKQGIASAITSRLALEIINRGKVPFYCCAWSNIKSTRNAIKSGFRPTWVQMTVKSAELVADMNRSDFPIFA
jgi:GNAT superfamily N-acetyltransferase